MKRVETGVTVTLKPHRAARVLTGHPWIYNSEVLEIPKAQDGEIVSVYEKNGRFLGQGLFNNRSQILIRMLCRGPERIDLANEAGFFRERLTAAVRYREKTATDTNAYRLIYSEGDGLPGLIVDRYNKTLVMQILSAGMDLRRELIISILVDLTGCTGIYERSESSSRTLEGLEPTSGVVYGSVESPLQITENGIHYVVDIHRGQKTGFFLDQRENRALIGRLSKGLRVLNCFSYTGGFSIAAAKGGATSVESLDISDDAIALAGRNAELNGVSDICQWEAANVFDRLPQYVREERRYDMIILDPPAFTKSKASIPGAIRGYKEINLRALKLLAPGGILVTCSCSHHIDVDTFKSLVQEAAMDAHRRTRVISIRGAGPDHPILLAAPETDYLKCMVIEVI
ncbi:MAG: class I SAM-dependent rRNA methyltransferase [Candidatus Sericytochromatia bacterium]|nr:class I SAM-dependent rRNA methyltransferase [Candidatus Sericytochromatia bacterium]